MYGHHRPHDRVKISFPEQGRTQQAFADECDINKIMEKHRKTGLIDHENTNRGDYSDYIGAPDFHTAQNKLIEAADMFQTVPANIRADFQNDPAKFLDFVQDPENQEALIELGLAKRRPGEQRKEPPPDTKTKKPTQPNKEPTEGDGDGPSTPE